MFRRLEIGVNMNIVPQVVEQSYCLQQVAEDKEKLSVGYRPQFVDDNVSTIGRGQWTVGRVNLSVRRDYLQVA